MKNILIVVFLLSGLLAHSQIMRHTEGAKNASLTFSPVSDGYIFQPSLALYRNNRLSFEISGQFEHIEKSKSHGSLYAIMPGIRYSLVRISQSFYLTSNLGGLIGANSHYNVDGYEWKTVAGIQAGLGLECFFSQRMALLAGANYQNIFGRIYGENGLRPYFGLAYHFR